MSLDNQQAEYLKETPDEVITRLSTLSLIEYEAVREDEAKKLNFRASILDKAVADARKETDQQNDDVVTSDEPFKGVVSGDAVLCEIEQLINTYMILPKGALTAVVLWIVGTYVYDAFRIYPKLAVISPEKRCGKTTLLDILSGICCRELLCSNISPAAIFRSIELWKPTLIIDEADTFLAGRNDEMIGIINSGHTRTTAKVMRLVGDEHTPKNFSTWSPMAFASIKGLAGTTMDRSITVQLRRRSIGEKVKRLPIDFKDDHTIIREKLVKWANDNFYKLKSNTIEPPEIPNDRAIDNWLPLFTIANTIGGKWPDAVESSYYTLNSLEEEETAAIMLLRDIKAIFDSTGWIKIHSASLVDELLKLEERPWCEWNKGNPMTQNSLSKILRTFSVHSKDIRAGIPQKVKRGFEITQFNDLFMRYIHDTPKKSATVLQASASEAFEQYENATESKEVALQKKPHTTADVACSTVALKSTSSEEVARDKGVL